MSEVIWNYNDHPQWDAHLGQACQDVYQRLRTGSPAERLAFLTDTRPVHQELFRRLTSPDTALYAGHYRGEDIEGLRDKLEVVQYPPHLGLQEIAVTIEPALVSEGTERLGVFITDTMQKAYARDEYLERASTILHDFWDIHPYIDGNGRISQKTSRA